MYLGSRIKIAEIVCCIVHAVRALIFLKLEAHGAIDEHSAFSLGLPCGPYKIQSVDASALGDLDGEDVT